MTELIERVHELADEVLFPAALEVDRTGVIPPSRRTCSWSAAAHRR
ncbi:MAG: hypothetical protein QM733_17570 [Ilumatobacteraceae bacterium]